MSDDDYNPYVIKGTIAGYPPWVSNYLIGPANCKTKEEASHLLHLLRSIEDGKPEETSRLLKGIDPNLRLALDDLGTESLLEWAAQKATHTDCIRLLIKAGASVQSKTLVYHLVCRGRTDLLPEVLQAGAEPNGDGKDETPLLVACGWSNVDAVRLLLNAGARTNAKSTFYITNKKKITKVTPLMVVAFAGELLIVKLLLEAGADVNAVDSAGNTALDWARISKAKAKAAKVITVLEQAGSNRSFGANNLPEPVDFSGRAKSAEFKEALNLAKSLTKSPARWIELEEGPVRGAQAFRIRDTKSALTILEEFRSKAAALNVFAFLCEGLHESSVPYLVLLPTTDYREAIVAFETPVGQSIDSYDLASWLADLEKKQPFKITHLAPDLLRARFTTPIKNPSALSKEIQKICLDSSNASVARFAKHLEESQELFLWWD